MPFKRKQGPGGSGSVHYDSALVCKTKRYQNYQEREVKQKTNIMAFFFFWEVHLGLIETTLSFYCTTDGNLHG